jgi:hypothetical protein
VDIFKIKINNKINLYIYIYKENKIFLQKGNFIILENQLILYNLYANIFFFLTLLNNLIYY